MRRETLTPPKGLLQCMCWIDYIHRVNAGGRQVDDMRADRKVITTNTTDAVNPAQKNAAPVRRGD
jgi:hypothetical protein